MHRHRLDVDPYLTFHFDADPDPDPDPYLTPNFTYQNFLFYFYSQQWKFTIFCLSRQSHGCNTVIINILDSILKFPKRMVYLVKMDFDPDPDPDLPKWCRSYRIRIHNTNLYRFSCNIVGMFAVLYILCRAVHSVAPSSELSLVRWSDISPASARSLEPSM